MIFLGKHEEVDSYLKWFFNIIKEKNIKWDKYDYINKIYKFHQKKDNINIKQLNFLMDKVLGMENLCIHDIVTMLLLFESFNQEQYFYSFI